MSHPANYYIRSQIYLGLTNPQISESLNALGISAPGDTVYAQIRTSMGALVGTIADVGAGDRQAVAYTKRKSIHAILVDLDSKDLIEDQILRNHTIRSLCERSLLAKVDFNTLEQMVKEELYQQYKPEVTINTRILRLYKHYFWNVDLLSTSQMLEYLHKMGGDSWHIESLHGGRDHHLYRTGRKKIDIAPDDAHNDLMMRLYMRASFVDSLPISEENDYRVMGLAKAYSGMWKNSKSVGNADMKEAYEELRKVTEERRNPDKEMAEGPGPMPGEDEEDEDEQ